MEELIALAIEKGGIIALLIFILVVLWLQFTRNSVPKDSYDHLLKRIDALDEDLNQGVLPTLKQLSEVSKNTQDTLSEIRRDQELNFLLGQRQNLLIEPPRPNPDELLRGIRRLDEVNQRNIVERVNQELSLPKTLSPISDKLKELNELLSKAEDEDVEHLLKQLRKNEEK